MNKQQALDAIEDVCAKFLPSHPDWERKERILVLKNGGWSLRVLPTEAENSTVDAPVFVLKFKGSFFRDVYSGPYFTTGLCSDFETALSELKQQMLKKIEYLQNRLKEVE